MEIMSEMRDDKRHREVFDSLVRGDDTTFLSEYHEAGTCWDLIDFIVSEIRKERDVYECSVTKGMKAVERMMSALESIREGTK